jgi:hypothetical protein
MIQNCNEQMLDDVVRVDIVAASECQLPIPFQVSGLTKMTVPNLSQWRPQTAIAALGSAKLSVSYAVQDGDDGELESAPALKQTEKRVAAGIVVTHDLQVPLTALFQATREAAALVQQTGDFHVILTTQESARYLLYSVPNASSLLLDEQGIGQSATLKLSLQSMSHVIRLE